MCAHQFALSFLKAVLCVSARKQPREGVLNELDSVRYLFLYEKLVFRGRKLKAKHASQYFLNITSDTAFHASCWCSQAKQFNTHLMYLVEFLANTRKSFASTLIYCLAIFE